jgi:hypothetical protein
MRFEFVVTQYGRPFTAAGFGNNMAEWCKEAGLAGLNSHGVRKRQGRGQRKEVPAHTH